MNNDLLTTLEILLIIDAPLLSLYLKGKWPLRSVILCLLSLPVLWYLTYAPLHELSHAAGTYLVGGNVTSMKLIPKFWLAEFGHAWIISEGITKNWQQLISASAPYLGDVVCIAASVFVLRRNFSMNPFIVGLVFMLLCLRPAFDVVCETIAFFSGNKGDFYSLQGIVGGFWIWSFILISMILSFFSLASILKRYRGFPEVFPVSGEH